MLSMAELGPFTNQQALSRGSDADLIRKFRNRALITVFSRSTFSNSESFSFLWPRLIFVCVSPIPVTLRYESQTLSFAAFLGQ